MRTSHSTRVSRFPFSSLAITVLVAIAALAAAPAASATTVTLPAASSIQGIAPFFSDVRVFNTSHEDTVTITATYYESLVFQVRKPGDPAATSGAVAAGGRLEGVPGGAIGTQETTTVTVKAVDMNVPSITVTTADGRTLTRKIAEKKNLEGVNPGDKIDITYSQGLVVSAEAAKK